MHEKNITVDIDGKYYNIPSVVGGRELDARAASDLAVRQGTLGTPFDTLEDAERAAISRSAAMPANAGMATRTLTGMKQRGARRARGWNGRRMR